MKPTRKIYETPPFNATKIFGEQIKILQENFGTLLHLPSSSQPGATQQFQIYRRAALKAFKKFAG